MPDFHSPEDEATLYVLGELTAADRRKFEARLAQSAELRALVRELEEGAVALSAALPQRRPPAEVWSGIEKAVSRDNRRNIPAWWISFWRNGWAAAAVCLAGWVLYAILWNGLGGSGPATTQSVLLPEAPIANPSPVPQQVVVLPAPTNVDRQLLQVRAGEIRDLSLKLTEMERETNELSQLLAQERARLGETNRIKFYHLTTASLNNREANTAMLSPALQRAVLISIGRELGWLPMTAQSRVANGRAVKTVDGIDFVDLRSPPSNAGNQPASQPTHQPQVESAVADAPEPSIPAFVSGDKLVVGVDSTVAPAGSSVTFTMTDPNSQATTSATLVMGENPTMITLPYYWVSTPQGDFAFAVSSVTSMGTTNFMQFQIPANP